MSNTLENLANRNHFAEKAAAAPLGSPERAELEGIVAQMERDQLDAELSALQQAAQRGSLSAPEKTRYAELLQTLQQLGRTGRRR